MLPLRPSPSPTAAAQRGFTLLELVAALAIFAMLAVMAYGGLGSIIQARESVGTAQERMTQWQRGVYRLRSDIESAVERPIRDAFGDSQAALYLNERGGLEFTRAGRRNPLDLPRPSLERVEYLLREQRLLRSTWPQLERVQGDEPVPLVLLEGIKDLRWRFLGDGEEWQATWPPLDVNDANLIGLPRAIELVLISEHYGELTFLFGLAGA